jgi:truncated hemoglobin YjbI
MQKNFRFVSLRRILLFLGFLLPLSGCSVKPVYNRLDWLIPWYLSDYMDFTEEQSADLERRIDRQLYWHRTTQLPAYADTLLQLRDQLQDGLSREELDYQHVALEKHWRNLAEQITPDATAILITATDAQVRELLDEFYDKTRDYETKFVALSPRQQRDKRAERLRKELRRWLGNLNDAQHQAIKDWSERLHLTSGDTLQHRRQWLVRLEQSLAQRRDEAAFEKSLAALLTDPEQYWSTAYRRKLDFNIELFKDLALQIDRHMTARQRTRIGKKLASLAEDFSQLAGDRK